MSDDSSSWFGVFGRLHPVLLHLPIGFITFLAVIEMAALGTRFKEAATARQLLLLLSTISVLIAAGCGWLLGWSGEYAGETLFWHKWLGTALVPAVIILQFLFRRRSIAVYRVWLGFTMVLLVVAGHFGGVLVRGEGYLFPKPKASAAGDTKNPGNQVAVPTKSERTAYAAMVQPILNEYCVSCHGVEKAKAKLRLDTAEHVFKGGEAGSVVHAGSAHQSLLIKRLLLPEDQDEHMPPSGKKQPKAHEIALLEWWINVGAPLDKTGGELKMPEAK